MTPTEDRASHRWAMALRRGAQERNVLIRVALVTPDELATAAARFGIVADPTAIPLNALSPSDWTERNAARARRSNVIARQRETGDCWAAVQSARAGKTTWEARCYENSDGFSERFARRGAHV